MLHLKILRSFSWCQLSSDYFTLSLLKVDFDYYWKFEICCIHLIYHLILLMIHVKESSFTNWINDYSRIPMEMSSIT